MVFTVKIAVDCKRGQIGLVSLVVCIVVINGIWTKSSLFDPVRAFQVPMYQREEQVYMPQKVKGLC